MDVPDHGSKRLQKFEEKGDISMNGEEVYNYAMDLDFYM